MSMNGLIGFYPQTNWDYCYNNASFVNYKLDNFTAEQFKKYMLKRVRTLINEMNAKRTKYKAKAEFEELFFDCEDITNKQIQESEYWDDWEKSEELSYHLQQRVQEDIIENVQEDLNSEYEQEVEKYIKNNNMTNEDLEKIKDRINKKIGVDYD